MKFSIKDFFIKCGQIRRKLWIWSHLLNGKLYIFKEYQQLLDMNCFFVSIKDLPDLLNLVIWPNLTSPNQLSRKSDIAQSAFQQIWHQPISFPANLTSPNQLSSKSDINQSAFQQIWHRPISFPANLTSPNQLPANLNNIAGAFSSRK